MKRIRIVAWGKKDREVAVVSGFLPVTNDTPANVLARVFEIDPDIAVMISQEHSPEWDMTFYVSELNGFHVGSRAKQPD